MMVQDQVARAATEDALAVALSQLEQHRLEGQAHQVTHLLFRAESDPSQMIQIQNHVSQVWIWLLILIQGSGSSHDQGFRSGILVWHPEFCDCGSCFL